MLHLFIKFCYCVIRPHILIRLLSCNFWGRRRVVFNLSVIADLRQAAKVAKWKASTAKICLEDWAWGTSSANLLLKKPWEVNYSRTRFAFVVSAVPPPLSRTFLCASSSTKGFWWTISGSNTYLKKIILYASPTFHHGNLRSKAL